MVQQQGVAVGLRLGDAVGAERAAGPGDILDDDLLPQHRAHRLRHQARDRVGRPAGREGNHDRDDLGGVVLGLGAGPGQQHGEREYRAELFHHSKPP